MGGEDGCEGRVKSATRTNVTVWTFQINPSDFSWQYMVMHGYTWQYTVTHAIHGYTWLYMAVHGNTSQYMAIHGFII